MSNSLEIVSIDTTETLPVKRMQLINGKAKLHTWAQIFSIEAKIEADKVFDRSEAYKEYQRIKAERSDNRQSECKGIANTILAGLKTFIGNDSPILLVVSLNGTGEQLPVYAKTQSELLAECEKIQIAWEKIVNYRSTLKGTGINQSDILSRSSVRLDVFINGKRKSNFASKAYYDIGQSRMVNFKAIVAGYLESFNVPNLPFAFTDTTKVGKALNEGTK